MKLFLNPGDIYLKKLRKEKDKNPNDYSKGSYLGDVSTISEYVNIFVEILNMLMVIE